MLDCIQLRRNIDRLRAQRRMNLERRRMEFVDLFILHPGFQYICFFFSSSRLANLLRDDEQRYVAEFEAMKDTPEKQMEKTRRRCLELKQKREMEDQAISAAIMNRKFQFAFTCCTCLRLSLLSHNPVLC